MYYSQLVKDLRVNFFNGFLRPTRFPVLALTELIYINIL